MVRINMVILLACHRQSGVTIKLMLLLNIMQHPLHVLSENIKECISSGSRGGQEGHAPPPDPVKISHKKDGRQRQPHRFHVSRLPLTWPLDPLLCIITLVARANLISRKLYLTDLPQGVIKISFCTNNHTDRLPYYRKVRFLLGNEILSVKIVIKNRSWRLPEKLNTLKIRYQKKYYCLKEIRALD